MHVDFRLIASLLALMFGAFLYVVLTNDHADSYSNAITKTRLAR